LISLLLIDVTIDVASSPLLAISLVILLFVLEKKHERDLNTMRLPTLVLFCFYAATESSLVPSALSSSIGSFLNVSDPGNFKPGPQSPHVGSTPSPIPPSNFSVSFALGGDALDMKACFMNSLRALETMALLEWEEPIETSEVYQIHGFTETRIEIVPIGEKLERRFAIWGIYLGISKMWSQNSFLSTTMTLSWDREAAGNIIFKLPQQTDTTSLERRSGSTSMYMTKHINATVGANVTADEPRCVPRFAPIGAQSLTMGFHDVLFPILASLVDLSFFPSSARLDYQPEHVYRRDWFRLLEGFNGRIFVFEHPRGEPPYLEYGDLIITLVDLVWYMVKAMRYGPTSIDISVDGVKVGAGTFLKRGMAPDPYIEIL